jgi:putative oxidoreductase
LCKRKFTTRDFELADGVFTRRPSGARFQEMPHKRLQRLGANAMARSSHPLSYADDIAASWTDFLLLVGRVLIGLLFLLIGWSKVTNISGTLAYFTSMNVIVPQLWPWPVAIGEVVIGLLLIAGLATRYAAIATFVWVLIATWIAHRWFQYPAAQQGAQYAHFTKNLAVMGGAAVLFVTGAGRIAIDAVLMKRG